jgi:hypothetical protein
MPWLLTVEVGRLQAGIHHLSLHITDQRIAGAPVLCATNTLVVRDLAQRIFMPVATR